MFWLLLGEGARPSAGFGVGGGDVGKGRGRARRESGRRNFSRAARGFPAPPPAPLPWAPTTGREAVREKGGVRGAAFGPNLASTHQNL